MRVQVTEQLEGGLGENSLRYEPRRVECGGCKNTAFFSCGEVACRAAKCDGGNKSVACNMIAPPGNWPLESHALGVNPNEIAEHRERYRSEGCPTEFTATGEPIVTSQRHQNRLLGLDGLVNKQSYYS